MHLRVHYEEKICLVSAGVKLETSRRCCIQDGNFSRIFVSSFDILENLLRSQRIALQLDCFPIGGLVRAHRSRRSEAHRQGPGTLNSGGRALYQCLMTLWVCGINTGYSQTGISYSRKLKCSLGLSELTSNEETEKLGRTLTQGAGESHPSPKRCKLRVGSPTQDSVKA